MSPIRPDKEAIRVVYYDPSPYVVVNAGFSSGATVNNLILTPEEARRLASELQAALERSGR